MCVCVLSHVQLFVTTWTVVSQAALPVDSPSKNTGVGSHFFLQGIFPTQGSNLCFQCLLHCLEDSFLLSHQENPYSNIRQITFVVMVGLGPLSTGNMELSVGVEMGLEMWDLRAEALAVSEIFKIV